MNEELKYLSYEDALVVYAKTVAASGGGLQGIKDEGGIRKVLEFVQNDSYYPSFVEKLTYLVFGLCTGHYFEDSNKRVALTVGVWFLVQNGYYWHAYNFMQCMEAIIYHVAAGRIDKDLLKRIISYYMANEDYPEDLKLEIIHAIDNRAGESRF
ncbi:MAG: Fic family protein [Muribaculaceae bacterium]|nr:Fic family protein [Muribaculaceae bacterium]